jgi:hypothetical protein
MASVFSAAVNVASFFCFPFAYVAVVVENNREMSGNSNFISSYRRSEQQPHVTVASYWGLMLLRITQFPRSDSVLSFV